MKKTLIVIVNAIIMAAILVFVVSYSRLESRDAYQRQIDYFVDTTVTIEHVTENYLEGEQNICDVWARYINSEEMTMQEVVDLLRDEHGWSDSVSNLSNKLQRESLRYVEAVQLADALGYEIVWQRRK